MRLDPPAPAGCYGIVAHAVVRPDDCYCRRRRHSARRPSWPLERQSGNQWKQLASARFADVLVSPGGRGWLEALALKARPES